MDNLTDKINRLNGLKNSKNVQHILNEASKILGHPILAHDMEYKIIAMSQNTENDDPIWNEYASTGTASTEWLLFFRDECFMEVAANAQKAVFMLSDKLEYERLFCKLFTKNNIQVGCSCMLACYKPFAPEDPQLFELACDILNRLLSNSRHYQRYGQEAMEKLLAMLIEDKMRDKLLYAAHVESIYFGLKNNLFVAVVDSSVSDVTPDELNKLCVALRRICPMYKYALYGNYILIILGTDYEEFVAERDLPQLCRYFSMHNIYAGVSSSFDNMFELGKYYEQALQVLQDGQNNSKRPHISLYKKGR